MKQDPLKVREEALARDVNAPAIGSETPHDPSAHSEAAQDAFQAALTSFQTERKDGKNLSLNGLNEEDSAARKERPKR